MDHVKLNDSSDNCMAEYVTFQVNNQLFGLPILEVHDVFLPTGLTKVPLASPEIAGILNLRGRIVTAINMARCLEMSSGESLARPMAIGVELRGEIYGLMIDKIGEVVNIDPEKIEAKPSNLDHSLSAFSSGVYPLEAELLVILNINKLLEKPSESLKAA